MVLANEQLDRLVGQGPEFERVLHALVRAEAWACGIAPHEIDWDFRTAVGDGGRDMLIRCGSGNSGRNFIPAIPSVWSAKSGKNGLSVATFRNEIDGHPKLREHLQKGGAYVWCAVAAAGNDETRDNLRAEAARISDELGLKPEQFVFFFRETITAWLNLQIGVASLYFNLPRGWKTLEEWKQRDKNFDVSWVGFGSRPELLKTIQEHLLGNSGPNVLHLAGWSGIGKTRTVLESCLQEKSLEGVLYFPNFDDFTQAEDYLIRNNGVRAVVVIDEVEFGHLNELRPRLAKYQDRIRVVTIGPTSVQSLGTQGNVVCFPNPDTEGGVSAVIRGADPALGSEQIFHLASLCDHDLRLALILVEANQQNPWLTDLPTASIDHVWGIVLNRFTSHIGDVNKFRELYDILCSCMDVGNKGQAREELEYLAQHFGKPSTDFDHVIAQAVACGLARQQGRFVELQRAFARHRFGAATWPRLESTVSDFLAGMPSLRMQERFIDRVHQCNVSLRDEIAVALGPWFREQFPTVTISLLQEREAARLFAAYAELNPNSGLSWLQSAVNNASPTELLGFDAKPDGSGFWRGRRNVVWLCENLAQFPEQFWTCEAILRRLAIHENEEGTVNNSRGVWQGFFRPLHSWTAVPFDERFEHLLKKLRTSEMDHRPMILGAAIGAIFQPTGETIPPKIVGGRVVPGEWRPSDLQETRAAAAAKIIQCAREADDTLATLLRASMIENLGTFLSLGCISQLRELLVPEELNEESLRQLRLNLDDFVNHMKVQADGSEWLDVHPSEAERAHARLLLSGASEWQQLLAPKDLATRVREVTARYVGQHNMFSPPCENETESLYTNLALDTISNPEVLERLTDWFDGGQAHSADEFGRILGRIDNSFVVLPQIVTNLADGRTTDLVGGYLAGIRSRFGILPEILSERIDSAGEAHPFQAVAITLRCDVGEAGFNRLLRLIPSAGPNASLSVHRLGFGEWGALLTDENKAQTIELLLLLGSNGDIYAYNVALELILHWGHQAWVELPEPIAGHAMAILEDCLKGRCPYRSHDWLHAIGKVPASYDQRRMELLAHAATDPRLPLDVNNGALSKLIRLAETSPQAVMNAIGSKALDSKTRTVFFFMNFRGLFEAIGLETVREWLEREGSYGALAIARHLLSPMPSIKNPTQIPPLTEWLLSKFEDNDDVFAEFCAGRHADRIFFGSLSAAFEGTEESMQPYLRHRLRRIREWAQDEIGNANWMRALDVQREAEFGRV